MARDDRLPVIDIIERHEFHGEWNYTILPSNHPRTGDGIS
jgi:hypothetical protein